MRLVEGWRQAWRWYSVHFFTLLAALPIVWMEIPEDVKALIPAEYTPWILTSLALAGAVSRLVRQPE